MRVSLMPSKEYYAAGAEWAASASKDSTKVGAILVSPSGEVILTGYNGIPKGVQDTPERRERPAKYLYAAHAEANLIYFAARGGIRTLGCTVHVTHLCCSQCAIALIQAGIVCVVAGDGKTSMPAEQFEAAVTMFKEAGVTLDYQS